MGKVMFSVCSHLGGGVRSVSRRGGGSGQSADREGSGQSADEGGGVSILRPLAGGMPLAFTQEDFLVRMHEFTTAQKDKKLDVNLKSFQ